jgi:hypothetical protein
MTNYRENWWSISEAIIPYKQISMSQIVVGFKNKMKKIIYYILTFWKSNKYEIRIMFGGFTIIIFFLYDKRTFIYAIEKSLTVFTYHTNRK